MAEPATVKQRRAVVLMHAYLHYHARPEYQPTAWLFLLLWADLGGKPSEVPREFGGSA